MSVSAKTVGGRPATGTLSLPWIIAASSVGTLIEWYDFYLYGVLAVFFSKHFFSPAMDPNVALIASLFVFWTGFLVRPFGAIVFGHLGFGDQAFGDWGWRVPFLISAVLVGLSIYIRLKLEESPLYARLKEQGKASHNPALESFSSGKNWGLILFALFGATAPEGVVWYTGQFYALFYLTTVLHIDYVTVYIILMVALSLGAPFFVVFGALSDRVGRRNIMTAGFALAVITYWPVFTWLGTFKDNPVILTILVFYMVILVTMVYGPIAAFLVELFPARIRYTSMSLRYHVGNGVFGGLVPAAGASIAAVA